MIRISDLPRLAAREPIETIPIGLLSPELFKNEFQTPSKPVILHSEFNEPRLAATADVDIFNQIRVDSYLKKINAHTGLRRKRLIAWRPQTLTLGGIDPLHLSGHDATLVQLQGKSRVILFPPHVTHNLYPLIRPLERFASYSSEVDLDCPNLNKFPKFKQALTEVRISNLDEGQTLYIPIGWWHAMQATSLDSVRFVHAAWKVEPIFRYRICPRAAYLGIIDMKSILKRPIISPDT